MDESGDQLAPAEAFRRRCTRQRNMADPAAFDLYLKTWGKEVRVGRNGITLWVRGALVRYGQFESLLFP